MWRRVLALFFLVSLFVPVLPAGRAIAVDELPPGGTFIDDDGHPSEPFIEAAVDAGFLAGCDPAAPDRFCPTARASWFDLQRAVDRVTGRSVPLSCAGGFCSALSVPPAVVSSSLNVSARLLFGARAGAVPIDRATLAVAVSVAADLELPEVPERRRFRLAATGDILPHTPVMRSAAANAGGDGFDFGPMFADIEPIISSVDLALCHLETPLSADNSALSSYPIFFSPREVVDAVVAAGYDGCSTASNHSFDKRTAGVLSTLSVIDDAGIGRAGTTDEEVEPAWWMYDVGGVAVAHLSYTYGLNGFRLPPDQPWLVNLIDEERIVTDAEAVRALGAEFVIVSLHWGNEYQPQPTGIQRELAGTLLSSPHVDLIIGHHAHVVQAVEMINGKYVLYGLGNLVSNQFFSDRTQDGVIAILDVVEGADGLAVAGVEFVPTIVERATYRIVPIPQEAAATPGDRSLAASWDRTAGALSLLEPSVLDLVVPIR